MVDDDDSGVFTAGAIVTVTVNLRRRASGEVYEQAIRASAAKDEAGDKEADGTIAITVSIACLLTSLSLFTNSN